MSLLYGVAVRVVTLRTAVERRAQLRLKVFQDDAVVAVGGGATRLGARLVLEALGAVATKSGLLGRTVTPHRKAKLLQHLRPDGLLQNNNKNNVINRC